MISLAGLPADMSRVDGPAPRLGAAFIDRPFLRYCLLVIGIAVLIAQFYLVIQYRAAQLLPGPTGIGLIYSAAAVLMVLTMLPLTGLANRFFPARATLAVAALSLGCGVAVIGMADSIAWMVAGVGIFVVGQMLGQPVLNAVVSTFAPDGSVASYFGVQGLANAIGGIAGSLAGGAIYTIAAGESDAAAWVWFTFPVWGAYVAVMFLLFGPRPRGVMGGAR